MSDTNPAPPPHDLDFYGLLGQLVAHQAKSGSELESLHETIKNMARNLGKIRQDVEQIRHAEAVIADGVLKLRQEDIDLDERLLTLEQLPTIRRERLANIAGNGNKPNGE